MSTFTLHDLEKRVQERAKASAEVSYTRKLIDRGDITQAMTEGLSSCTECGCCAFACPSRIPLVESLKQGKRREASTHHG